MKMEIQNENYNRLMKRKEVSVLIEHPEQATPAAASVQHLMAKQFGTAIEKTEIKTIVTNKGSSFSKCTAFVWDEKHVKDLAVKEVAEKKEGE